MNMHTEQGRASHEGPLGCRAQACMQQLPSCPAAQARAGQAAQQAGQGWGARRTGPNLQQQQSTSGNGRTGAALAMQHLHPALTPQKSAADPQHMHQLLARGPPRFAACERAVMQEPKIRLLKGSKAETSYSPVLHDGALKVQLPGDAARGSCRHASGQYRREAAANLLTLEPGYPKPQTPNHIVVCLCRVLAYQPSSKGCTRLGVSDNSR